MLVTDGVPKCGRIVSLVGQYMVRGKVSDQFFGLGEVADVPRRQDEAQRVSQSIDNSVDLGG